MVVARAYLERFEVGVYVAAYLFSLAKVHRRALYQCQLAGGYLRGVGGQVPRGLYFERVAEHRPAVAPREVKIGVVGEVYDSVVVGAGEIGYLYSAFVVEVVDRFAAEFGRIALLACRRGVGEYHTVGLHARGPYLVLKSARTAVQMVDAVVAGQNVLLAAERETSLRYAVGITAYAFAHGGRVVQVTFVRTVSEHHVAHIAVAVGHLQRHYGRTYVGSAESPPFGVGHAVEYRRLSVGCETQYLLFYLHVVLCFCRLLLKFGPRRIFAGLSRKSNLILLFSRFGNRTRFYCALLIESVRDAEPCTSLFLL